MIPNQIICGDSLDVLKTIDANSVHSVITSPPYFANKSYEVIKKDDINIVDNWEKYVGQLVDIFTECHRVLVNGGHLWINIDDAHTSLKSSLKKNIVLPTHSKLIIELSKIFDFKEMILWKKIRGKSATGGASQLLGSWGRFGSPGSIPIVQEVEYILWFKKSGTRKDLNDERRKESALTREEFRKFGMQIWEIRGVVGKNNKMGHPCPFPLEIPERCIKLSSFIGDTILDPFNGVGTTTLAAKNLKRNYIGIDYMEEYCITAVNRLKQND